MKSTEGIEWNLHKRWCQKYNRALWLAKGSRCSARRARHWARRFKAIVEKYPFAEKPLRYAVRFDRVVAPKVEFQEDITALKAMNPLSLLSRA